MNIAVARNVYICDSNSEMAAARRALAEGTQRIVDVSRDADNPKTGSHVLAYQDPGAADAHALYGTPTQVADGLNQLQDAGVGYALLIFRTDVTQLHRFHQDVIPRLRT